METSAVVSVIVSERDPTLEVAAMAPALPPSEPEAPKTWAERFPGTAQVVEQINARHTVRLQQQRERVERDMAREEQKRIDKLTQTKDGRLELARLATAATKRADEANRLRNEAMGKSAASDENKRKRAERREHEREAAAKKKAEQESQGRGGGGGGKGKGKG